MRDVRREDWVDVLDRRLFLAAAGSTAAAGVAGCMGDSAREGDGDDLPEPVLALSATTGVETDADGRVTTWRDQSGNGNDVTAPSPASRPSLTEDTSSGRPALVFDGEDDHLLREDALGIPDDSARTLVAVSRLAETDRRSPVVVQGTYGSSGGDSNYWGIEANTWHTAGERFGVYLVSVAHDAEHATDTDYHVHSLTTESFPELEAIRDSTAYHLDGVPSAIEHTEGGAFNSPFAADATAIGAFPQNAPGTVHVGEIAAVRVYDRALSDAERRTVESSLAEPHGIVLA